MNVIQNTSKNLIKYGLLLLLGLSVVSTATATEIESGYIQVTSTGTMTEDIGFRPDYIEFISAQQIESLNFENSVATNSNCPQNVNGWSEGSVIFDDSGVDKQFSIGAFRNSDSTNSHRVASSTSHVIKNVYTGRNGGQCGELRISVTQPLNNGFEVDVESKYGQYDEIVRYKAYQFPDNMEFDAGMVKVTSTGSIDVNTGFSPANIHIRAGQQINGKNVERSFDPNDPEQDNTLGRSKGYATLDSDGTLIDQQSIGTASSSDSTNAHRSIASNNYVLNTAYVGQDGNLFGRLRARVTGADSTGFNLQVDDKWSQTDEVFLYRAWSESYYDFKIGYRTYPSTYTNWASSEPNDQSGEDCAEMYDSGGWNDIPCDDSTNHHIGLCEYGGEEYNTTGSAMSWSSAKNTCDSWGGNLVVIDDSSKNTYLKNNYGNVWIGYLQSSGGSEPGGGWRWIREISFNTGFKPDAIDIYSEQQIDSINQEVVTPTNSGCANAGGWSNGFYEADDNRQWAIGMGRTSDSQNSHRQGSTTSLALNNMYSGQNGGDCGNFEGQVTDVSSTGFDMNFNLDSNFESNYGTEMVYFRAFNFQLAPPQPDGMKFTNSSEGHAFKVEANFSEGSNDIDRCEIRAEDGSGNVRIYDESDGVEAVKVSDSKSKCIYDSIRYDDNGAWENRHNLNNEIIGLNIEVTAEDVDGQSASQTGYNTFPNNKPTIKQLSYTNYTQIHGFNVTAEISDQDSINPNEIESCSFEFDDGDGTVISRSGDIDYTQGTENEAVCFYSNVNSSMASGFEVLEEINIEATLNDSHDKQDLMTGSNVIPNSVPNAFNPDPRDGAIITGDEDQKVYIGTEVTDAEEDPLTVYYFNDSGQFIKKIGTSNGNRVSVLYPGTEVGETYDWNVKVGDTYENYSSNTFSFTKTTRFAYRTQPRIEYSYSSIILDETDTRAIRFKVENRISESKDLVSYISGVNASFAENQQKTIDYKLEGNSEKDFLVIIEPSSKGDKTLTITTENQKFGVNTTTQIPVTVKNYTKVSATSEVPGIGIVQLIMLLLVSAYLYSARL